MAMLTLNESLSPNFDDLLLDLVIAIELSPRDREIVENRYRRLKEHLERTGSPLATHLSRSESHIYAQGSVQIGAVIVSGDADDRYDLDALVELDVPADWDADKPLDMLYKALKDFPDAVEVVRCTRCVQLRFAFMHMDVTILDPRLRNGIERAGEIFHSPDKGESFRVLANPFGFSQWFRDNVQQRVLKFRELLNERRAVATVDRLAMSLMETAAFDEYRAAHQHDLPQAIPPQIDSEQVLALKLLKRYVLQSYARRTEKRPPSIYLSKLAIDVGYSSDGLCSQLLRLASRIEADMRRHIAQRTSPDERNPSFPADRLNDRWPTSIRDMELLADDMHYLTHELTAAMDAEFGEIAATLTALFGEKITTKVVKSYMDRSTKVASSRGSYIPGKGLYIASSAPLAPAVAKAVERTPAHNFHCGFKKK